MNKTDSYWNILNSIDDSIKFADAKAIALLSIYSILITIVFTGSTIITSFAGLSIIRIIVLIISSLSFVVSIYYAFKCLMPSFTYKSKESVLFFLNISNKYKTADAYFKSSYQIISDENKLLEQLAEQVYTKSIITKEKYKHVKISVNFFIVFIVSLFISVVLNIL